MSDIEIKIGDEVINLEQIGIEWPIKKGTIGTILKVPESKDGQYEVEFTKGNQNRRFVFKEEIKLTEKTYKRKYEQLKEKLNKIEEYCINQELTAVFGGSILEGKLAGISVAKNKILEIIKEEEQ